MLKEVKTAFKDGRTRDISWRIKQLQSMQKGLEEMKVELCEAVQQDLGRGPFLT